MEAKEISDFLGIEAENLEQFKEKFGTKYYTEKQIHENKDLLGKFTGKTLSKVKQNILKQARDMEIPFTNSEFDEMDVEDIVKTLKTRQAEKFTTQIEEYKGQIGKSGEEAVKPYVEKLSKFEQALADEKKAKADLAAQFDQFKQQADTLVKSTRIDYFKKDLMTSIEFDPQKMNELTRKGWESHISENFKFDYDEQDHPIITDKTGAKIPNPKKAGEWLPPKDVLTIEADKLGLIKKNPQGGQPAFKAPQTTTTTTTPAPTPSAPNRRAIAPWLQK